MTFQASRDRARAADFGASLPPPGTRTSLRVNLPRGREHTYLSRAKAHTTTSIPANLRLTVENSLQ